MLAQLRTAGFAVQARVVATETNFLAALTPEPDVILCDSRLPGFSGAHALKLLKDRLARLGSAVTTVLKQKRLRRREILAQVKSDAGGDRPLVQ